jgi:hypothetical protein
MRVFGGSDGRGSMVTMERVRFRAILSGTLMCKFAGIAFATTSSIKILTVPRLVRGFTFLRSACGLNGRRTRGRI